MTPDEGRSYPESRLSSVVLPQPDGPTTATNSPRRMFREISRSTSTAPNDRQTFSSCKGLPLIPPSHTRNFRQLRQQAIDHDADQSDHYHFNHQQIGAQAVARIHHREAQPVAPGDHLGGDNHEPRKPRSHPERRDHLRHDRGQRNLRQILEALQAVIPRDSKVDRRNVRHRGHRRQRYGEKRRQENQKDRRRVADAEPQDRKRDPRQRRKIAEKVDDRQKGQTRRQTLPHPQAHRNSSRNRDHEAAAHAKERSDQVVEKASAAYLFAKAARHGHRRRKLAFVKNSRLPYRGPQRDENHNHSRRKKY